jgi:hypothetical protein
VVKKVPQVIEADVGVRRDDVADNLLRAAFKAWVIGLYFFTPKYRHLHSKYTART